MSKGTKMYEIPTENSYNDENIENIETLKNVKYGGE